MKSRRDLLGLVISVLVVSFIVGCGAGPTPTATPLPATAVPTAIPSTAVPPPTTAPATSVTTGGGTLVDALDAVKAATTYKVDLTMTGRGSFMAAGGPTPVPGAEDTPIILVNMQGQVDGNNAHFVLQGLLTSFLGIEPDQKFEVISAGGNAYLKGPVPLLGALEEKWYLAPPEAASVAQPPLTPGSFLDSFSEAGINPADFKSAGAESLDGQSCEVFAGDREAVVNAFGKLGGATGASQKDLESIDNAEFKFWVCPDGYLHQVKMLIEGHDKDKPDQKGSFEILMKITDFDGSVTITEPQDALPLNIPQFAAPSPTP